MGRQHQNCLVRKVYYVLCTISSRQEQWCWYPVEEQLHRKAPELVARGRRAPHQSHQPKLLKLLLPPPLCLLFPTFGSDKFRISAFYIPQFYISLNCAAQLLEAMNCSRLLSPGRGQLNCQRQKFRISDRTFTLKIACVQIFWQKIYLKVKVQTQKCKKSKI